MVQHIDRYFLKAQLDAYAREHGHMAALECIAWFFERCNGKLRGTFSAEKLNMEEVEEALDRIIVGRKVCGDIHSADRSRQPRREPTQQPHRVVRRPSPMANDEVSAL